MRSTIRVAELLSPLRIGCAGWSLPRDVWPRFPNTGSHLERYGAVFDAVEINSSFYRPHRRETYARWAGETPEGFRFAVKLPKTITHEKRLADPVPALDEFRCQVAGLGDKLGCLLVQLPPSLAFDAGVVWRFLAALRRRYQGGLALEPRHASWFTPEAEALLAQFKAGRVLADPVLHAGAAAPGGWPALVYLRLHGSPRRYWSAYAEPLLQRLAQRLHLARSEGAECWCIFDNTASGAAVGDALALTGLSPASVRQAPLQ
ncbi:MAG: DUF72 domain-containing protein [Variovorax sp.]